MAKPEAAKLVLASKSPRRRQLMKLVAPGFVVDEAGVDESGFAAETPRQLAAVLAGAKARAVFARRPQDVVIGCDTVVEAAGQVLGKPRTKAQAVEMLALLADNWHHVYTGLCIFAPGMEPVAFTEETRVHFLPVPVAEMDAYAQTDEPYDKAGGYGVQGWAARYIDRIEGCYYNVMGLPVASLYHKLLELSLLAGG